MTGQHREAVQGARQQAVVVTHSELFILLYFFHNNSIIILPVNVKHEEDTELLGLKFVHQGGRVKYCS